MEEQFIRLQHWNKSVNQYVAEFLRLSRSALYMVSDEEKRATRFQQGLKMDIQIFLIPQQLKIYSQVLTISREVERGLEKKNHTQMQNRAMKRSFQQMGRGDPVRPTGAPLSKRPFQLVPLQMIRLTPPQTVCNYC